MATGQVELENCLEANTADRQVLGFFKHLRFSQGFKTRWSASDAGQPGVG